jgi:hypothetical protein
VRLYTGDCHRELGLPQQTMIVTNATVTVALEALSLPTTLTVNIEQQFEVGFGLDYKEQVEPQTLRCGAVHWVARSRGYF